MLGPILIFDKSALEALSPDEAVWLDTFYRTNITPLFFIETLADLQKKVATGRTPEDVVGRLAHKTPVLGSLPNVHHRTLCLNELLGFTVEMQHFPVIGGGERIALGDQRGLLFRQPPEMEALDRWQRGEFLEVEHHFASAWRKQLSGLDLGGIYQAYRQHEGQRPKDLMAVKGQADRLLRKDGNRYTTLKFAMTSMGVPLELCPNIVARWKQLGGAHLYEFAPYTAHIIAVDLFFNLGIGADLIGRERPSNKVDLAYLYYLPFCMVFASNDRLHRRCAPCFLQSDQVFVSGDELKADLAKLDAYYTALPAEEREKGVMVFAQHPPLDGDFLVTRLWDRFLPKWREMLVGRSAVTAEQSEKILEHLDKWKRAERITPDESVDVQTADVVQFQRLVPPQRGKWRLISREIEEAEREKRGRGRGE